jgi:uncharacterized protein YodC (DUF2158 family)
MPRKPSSDDEKGQWEQYKKTFPKGAKVQLNVGGPTMVVKNHVEPMFGPLHEKREILCQWFSGKKLETGSFAPETLVLVKDDDRQSQK